LSSTFNHAHCGRAARPAADPTMIGIRIIAHDTLGDSLVQAVTHVLGARPPNSEAFAVRAGDDPLQILPQARAAIARLDDGDGVLVVSDIYGATPCNLACKLLQPGRVVGLAGASLPMLVRAFTYRTRGMEALLKKAVSGGCDGVVRIESDPVYATTRG
jgi:PTS system mannose-specific IIA component